MLLMGAPSGMLLIRADAGSEIGTGHVMRSFALAQAWQRTGGRVTCAMAETIPAIADRLQAHGIATAQIAGEPGSDDDACHTCELALSKKAVWTVVDSYRCGPAFHRAVKNAGLRLMVLDDDGRFSEYSADVVLNQNLAATERLYAKRGPDTLLLLGTQFALLRPEFLAERRERQIASRAQRILVTMGGGDADNATGKVMEALSALHGEIQATVVVGSGNPNAQELAHAAARLGPGVRLEKDPGNMAPLMVACDFAVSGAGSTCWELAYLGVPMMLVVLSRDQQEIARSLAKRGVAVSLGWHANLSTPELISSIQALASDPARRRAMTGAGQKLVDGRGAERVVEFLRNHLCR